ncbi:cellulose-binding protein [Micromonospora endophytica]|uniref:Cellulose-binding protein n=1 Tax=Micromonospora endophytica TaxID=515350 RepID=A0A2W2BWL7_9ACTN|nr:cellulose-binding protein [Micromonospora endophytica]RIW40629.1 cellulose-binding protein [Micromonospora endophytica]
MSLGVVVMLVLLGISIRAYRSPGPDFNPVPPGPPLVAPPVPMDQASSAGRAGAEEPAPAPAVPGLSPRRTDPPIPSGSASATPEPPAEAAPQTNPPAPPQNSAPPSVAPPAPPALPPLEAQYRVMQTFPGGFIGELSIRNAARSDLGWVARLDYPGGRLVTAWLEGTTQGTLSERQGTFTYRSGPDLGAGASVLLRFHIESADPRPASCTISGRSCAGL